jgi:integrase
VADEKQKRKMSRETGRLSARKVETLKKPGYHPDGGGLYLRITESGAKSYFYRYATGSSKRKDAPPDAKSSRRERWMALGPARDVGLAEARIAVAECRRLRWQGKDPLDERRAARQAAALEKARGVTFKAAAELYISAHEPGWRNAKHGAQWRSTLETYVYPVFGDSPVQDVDVTLVMRALEQKLPLAKGKPAGSLWTARPETAARVRGRIESVLDWATARGYRKGENPARWRGHLQNLLPARSKVQKVEHHPALPYVEIGAFIAALRQQEGTAAMALDFLILTAARTGEVIGATWSEIDMNAALWTIPADRIKAGKEHRVPLPAPCVAMLRKLAKTRDSEFVFQGGRRGKPLSNMAMLALLDRMNRSDLTTHGFRSTFRDWASEQTNFPREVAEMALAHAVSDKVEAAYRRGDLFQKRQQLMDAWAKYCGTPSKASGNVVQIGRTAGGAA